MTLLFASILACGLFTFDEPARAEVKEPKIRDEILSRAKKEQELRFKLIKVGGLKPSPEEIKSLQEVDTDNRTWMKNLIEKQGWPGKTLVGEEAAHMAWLMVQHADPDLPFQKKCLELLKAAVKQGEATGADLAYLTDRVLAAEGKKQLYGTQLQQKEGKFIPKPVEDEANLDARRKELGLQPMAEYLEVATKMFKLNDKPAKK
ncbi:hypothetical protein KIH39_19755 [Telmatocola sphagniphila]|uniref:Uncharacterized protein n=1 Tax=Telmatocola sphagniphila TaxID=1123043 RepID=A0A8E6B341_9BACT|nr:DUF6624 domain-containing protein [Telmatocola sphagniphila]QVL31063.1 hypothetical protein KIH39_19755 [Telmatocola sphagniphila]